MAVKLMHLPGKPAGVSILKLNGYLNEKLRPSIRHSIDLTSW